MRGKSWTELEDIWLASIFLRIYQEAEKTGNAQKGAVFWGKIVELYNSDEGKTFLGQSYTERGNLALSQHFRKIHSHCQKFTEYYMAASGIDDYDKKMKEVLYVFKMRECEEFLFIECWRILLDSYLMHLPSTVNLELGTLPPINAITANEEAPVIPPIQDVPPNRPLTVRELLMQGDQNLPPVVQSPKPRLRERSSEKVIEQKVLEEKVKIGERKEPRQVKSNRGEMKPVTKKAPVKRNNTKTQGQPILVPKRAKLTDQPPFNSSNVTYNPVEMENMNRWKTLQLELERERLRIRDKETSLREKELENQGMALKLLSQMMQNSSTHQ